MIFFWWFQYQDGIAGEVEIYLKQVPTGKHRSSPEEHGAAKIFCKHTRRKLVGVFPPLGAESDPREQALGCSTQSIPGNHWMKQDGGHRKAMAPVQTNMRGCP